MRVYHALPRFSLRCKFTTWLFQVTKNRVLDELRARERRPQSACSLEDLPSLAEPRARPTSSSRRSKRSGAPCRSSTRT